jgi:hypothetical protein
VGRPRALLPKEQPASRLSFLGFDPPAPTFVSREGGTPLVKQLVGAEQDVPSFRFHALEEATVRIGSMPGQVLRGRSRRGAVSNPSQIGTTATRSRRRPYQRVSFDRP